MTGISVSDGKRPPVRNKIIDFFLKEANQNRQVLRQELCEYLKTDADHVVNAVNGILRAPHYHDFAKHLAVVSPGKVWKYVTNPPSKPIEAVKPGLEERVIEPASDEDLALLGHRREVRDHPVVARRRVTGSDIGRAIEAALDARPKVENIGLQMSRQHFEAVHGDTTWDMETRTQGVRVFLRSADGKMWVAKPVDY